MKNNIAAGFRLKKTKVSLLSILLLFLACKNKNGNEINICLYGKYKTNSHISISLDGKTVHQIKIDDSKFSERKLPSIYTDKNSAQITLKVNNTDTTFRCKLEKKNYLNMAYSTFQHQFQVLHVDSETFKKSGDDVIYEQ